MVKIVTDSTADIPEELAAELGITIVPCNVHFGLETYRDGINLSKEEFYTPTPRKKLGGWQKRFRSCTPWSAS